MEDEPIRILTHEQFEAHRASIIASRAREQAKRSAPQSEVSQPQSVPPNAEVINPPSAQALELGSQIWEMRTRGLSCYEVSNRLGIPMESIREILAQFEKHFYPDVGQAMSSRLALDDTRLDELFRTWLPIATGGPIPVKKVDRKGREYTECDTDTPLKAAGIVLSAIQRRLQITMACQPGNAGGGKDGPREINIVTWLQTVMPSVQAVVNQVNGAAPISRGKQNLVLECEAEAEIDGSPTNGQRPSGGSSR
jgi:hypothetical protein